MEEGVTWSVPLALVAPMEQENQAAMPHRSQCHSAWQLRKKRKLHLPRVEPAGGLVGVAAQVALVVGAGRGRRVERVRERQRRAGVGPRAVAHQRRLDEALRPCDAHLTVARAAQRVSGSDCSRRCQQWLQLVTHAAAVPIYQGPCWHVCALDSHIFSGEQAVHRRARTTFRRLQGGRRVACLFR